MKGVLKVYALGFFLSLLLTFASFWTVSMQLLPRSILIPLLIGMALIQAAVQLVCFLHLGRGAKPDWNLTVFLFMLLVLIIIVGGSLWIMYNLNYRMMPEMT